MNHAIFRTTILVLSLGSAIACASWAFHQYQAVRHTVEPPDVLKSARTGLSSQLQKEQEASLATETEITRLQTSLARLRTSNQPLHLPVSGAATTRELVNKALLNQPDLQNLCLAAERASLVGRYSAFFQSLKLKPDQIEKLTDLLCRRNELEMDLEDIARAHQFAPDEPTLTKTRDNARKSFRTDFVNAFGESSYATLVTYERKLPVWDFVNKLAGAVAVVDEPITPKQATALVDTLAMSCPAFRDGGTANPDTIDWPAAISQAAPLLTPPQNTALRNSVPSYPVPVENQTSSSPATSNE